MVKAGTYRIPVVTRTQDNGDGGFTTHAYNNEDELIADHPKSNPGGVVNGEWVRKKVVLSPEERALILNDDDPYENGMIGRSEIVVNIAEDGTMTLAKSLNFHAGQ